MKKEFDVVRERKCDVLIIGGGIAGASAAIASARHGADTVICEQSGVLGGQATLGIVTPIGSIRSRAGAKFGGLIDEIEDETRRLASLYTNDADEKKIDGIASPHVIKYLLLKLCRDSGAKVMFHTSFVSAETENGKVTAAYVLTKNGIEKIRAEEFIDASGDGDLFVSAGEDYALGSEPGVYDELRGTGLDSVHYEENSKPVHELSDEAGLMQPVSIFFTMGNVDYDRAAELNNKRLTYEDLSIPRDEFRALPYFGNIGFEENGDLIPLPQGRVLVSHGARSDMAVVNMSRINGINAADADDLDKGEIEAQLQLISIVDLLKRYVPGFENSYLIESGMTLGIRESRRLKGKYILRGSEVIACKHFENAIARGSYMIDIHDPKGKNKAMGGDLSGEFYEIPFGCLCGAKNSNLFVCGRCISVDHIAHSSTRIQGTCIMTGQAAGVYAASAAKGAPLSEKELHEALIRDGVKF